MNEPTHHFSDDEDRLEKFVARTLSQVGSRRDAPADIKAEIEAQVEQSWRAAVAAQQRRRVRHMLITALAASVAIAAVLIGIDRWPASSDAPAGIFVASKGKVQIDSPAHSMLASGGQMLPANTRIRTGPNGRVLLAISNISLRIGADSSVRLQSADSLELEQGLVYFDSNASAQNGVPFTIKTAYGRIAHAGTQYLVAVAGDRMTLSVRDGHVRVTSKSGLRNLAMREQLTVMRDGTAALRTIDTFGEPWNWTSELMPDFPIEGRSLGEFFAWFTRESGIPVQYADEQTRLQAQETAMSGSIAGLTPLQALQGVLTATRFAYSAQADGAYRIALNSESRAKLSRDGAESPDASLAPR